MLKMAKRLHRDQRGITGLETARSSMSIVGSVVANTLEGEAIDLNTTVDSDQDGLLSDEASPTNVAVITYLDKNQRIDDLTWIKTEVGKGDGDDLLGAGEKFELLINLEALSTLPVERTEFALHPRPGTGSSITVEKTIPGTIDKVMNLDMGNSG